MRLRLIALVLAAFFTPAFSEIVFNFDDKGDAGAFGRPQNAKFVLAEPGEAWGPKGGNALRITSTSEQVGGFVYTVGGKIPEIRNQAVLRMRVYYSPQAFEADNNLRLEVQLLERGGLAKFWRKVDITKAGWQQVEIPLRHMRMGTRVYPRWPHIRHLGFYVEARGDVWIDDVELLERAGLSAELSVGELAKIAFSERTARLKADDEVMVLTDSKQVDIDKLHGHLKKVVRSLRRDLPLPVKLPRPGVLIVFDKEAGYRGFASRLAESWNAGGHIPQSDGHTLQHFAHSYWAEKFREEWPVYTHEFAHSVLAGTIRLPNGDWLQEGLASMYQQEFHPQANMNQIVQHAMADPRKRLPLKNLCNGRRIGINDYWQAKTVVRMLVREPEFRKHVPGMILEMQKRGSSDLTFFVRGTLKSNWVKFEQRWEAYCAKTYGARQ